MLLDNSATSLRKPRAVTAGHRNLHGCYMLLTAILALLQGRVIVIGGKEGSIHVA